LQGQLIIKKIVAIFFAFLLLLSMAPKIVLHDLVAHHRDKSFSTHSTTQTEVSKAGFNCHFDDFVCESPFIPYQAVNLYKPLLVHQIFSQFYKSSFSTPHYFYAALRGPPALQA